jgi:hypothetical protein
MHLLDVVKHLFNCGAVRHRFQDVGHPGLGSISPKPMQRQLNRTFCPNFIHSGRSRATFSQQKRSNEKSIVPIILKKLWRKESQGQGLLDYADCFFFGKNWFHFQSRRIMPPSFGYWIDPRTGQFYVVRTHQDWILEHASIIGVASQVIGLDSQRDEDEIRIIGCKAGLVRIRDYGPKMSVQFWVAEPERVNGVLRAVRDFMPKIGVGPLKSVWVHNLTTGNQVTLLASKFIEIVDGGGELFR